MGKARIPSDSEWARINRAVRYVETAMKNNPGGLRPEAHPTLYRAALEAYNLGAQAISEAGDVSAILEWKIEDWKTPTGRILRDFALVSGTYDGILHTDGGIKNQSGRDLNVQFFWTVTMTRTDLGDGDDKVQITIREFDEDDIATTTVRGQSAELSTSSVDPDSGTKGNSASGGRLYIKMLNGHKYAVKLTIVNGGGDEYSTVSNACHFSIREIDAAPAVSQLET